MVEVSFTFIGSSKASLELLCREITAQTGVSAKVAPLNFNSGRLTLSAHTRQELEKAEAYLENNAKEAHYFQKIVPRPR